jgi:hypothetical protein
MPQVDGLGDSDDEDGAGSADEYAAQAAARGAKRFAVQPGRVMAPPPPRAPAALLASQLAPEAADDADVFETGATPRPVRVPSTPLAAAAAAAATAASGGARVLESKGDGDSDLGSDLDDEEDALDDSTVADVVLCQWEKVSRSKSKWKCQLKDGIIRIGDRDFVFNKGASCALCLSRLGLGTDWRGGDAANGEFDFM